MNRVVMIGRLGKDPEVRTTTTGKTYATFSIAVRRRIKDGDRDCDWFSVKVWGQSAEYAKNYLAKGRLVAVDGRLETRKYTDQQGNNREVVEIVAENLNALDGPKDDAKTNDEYDALADE
jgi:single-strand DNA-binding protein